MMEMDYYVAIYGESSNPNAVSEMIRWIGMSKDFDVYERRAWENGKGKVGFDYNEREPSVDFVEVFGGGSGALWDCLRGWSRTHSAGNGKAGSSPNVLKMRIPEEFLHSRDIVDAVEREWEGYHVAFFQEECKRR